MVAVGKRENRWPDPPRGSVRLPSSTSLLKIRLETHRCRQRECCQQTVSTLCTGSCDHPCRFIGKIGEPQEFFQSDVQRRDSRPVRNALDFKMTSNPDPGVSDLSSLFGLQSW